MLNFAPKDRIRVSEMSEVPRISDSAVILVIQDKTAYKMSINNLKEVFKKDILAEISDINTNMLRLSAEISLLSCANYTHASDNAISAAIDDLSAKTAEIEKSLSKKRSQKLEQLSQKFDKINNVFDLQINHLSTTIDESLDAVTADWNKKINSTAAIVS